MHQFIRSIHVRHMMCFGHCGPLPHIEFDRIINNGMCFREAIPIQGEAHIHSCQITNVIGRGADLTQVSIWSNQPKLSHWLIGRLVSGPFEVPVTEVSVRLDTHLDLPKNSNLPRDITSTLYLLWCISKFYSNIIWFHNKIVHLIEDATNKSYVLFTNHIFVKSSIL